MIEFSGIAFRHVDNRVMSLKLVQLGLSSAAMFAAKGEVLQPSEVLYKKPILVERGSFRPVTHVNVDMLRCAHEKFLQEPGVQGEDVVQLMEITMHNLLAGGELDYRDFLARADVLAAVRQDGADLRLLRVLPAGRVPAPGTPRSRSASRWAPPACCDLFDEKYYAQLDGGILESFGRLFKNDLKLYIYPLLDPADGRAHGTVENFEVAPKLRKLYGYLVDKGCIEQLNNFDPKYLPIFSRDVLEQIKDGDPSWEDMVPLEVAEVIKRRGFFGYRRNKA